MSSGLHVVELMIIDIQLLESFFLPQSSVIKVTLHHTRFVKQCVGQLEVGGRNKL